MEKKRKNHDLWCENCSHREATTLLYYIKPYADTGRICLINPSLVCDECSVMFNGLDRLFRERPILIHFSAIGQWDFRLMGITSKKRIKLFGQIEAVEWNALSQSYWVKRLRRIIYIWKDYKPNEAVQVL